MDDVTVATSVSWLKYNLEIPGNYTISSESALLFSCSQNVSPK